MVLDLISDLIARINNGYMAKLHKIKVLNSRQTMTILALLLKLGYLSGFKVISNREIEVYLVYFRNQPAVRKIQRVSKPKQRIYFGVKELQNRSALAYSQNGFFIMSTTAGIITDVEAMMLGVGGEVLFQIV